MGINWVDNNSAPNISTENVNAKIYLIILTNPCIPKVFIASCIRSLSLKVIFFLTIKANKVVKDMNPNPPICIKIIMTVFPK